MQGGEAAATKLRGNWVARRILEIARWVCLEGSAAAV